MKNENDLIIEKLAGIRDDLFEDSDFVSNEGYDLTGSYVGSPYEVLCGAEEKLIRQKKEIQLLESAVEEDDITKTRYSTSMDELISLVLWSTRRLKHQYYKDFAYDELEKITGMKHERV